MDAEQIKTMILKASGYEIELVWLPYIMKNQTTDEIEEQESIEQNRRGLNGLDAPIVTSMYNRVIRGKHLSDKQVLTLKKILPKYYKQYLRLAKDAKQSKLLSNA